MTDATDRPADAAAPKPDIAHEISSTANLAARDLPTSERELMLVDRIIVLENKLAETIHRYKAGYGVNNYPTPPPPPVEPLPYQRARDAYSAILKVPGVGALAQTGVRAAKKVRAARR